MENTEKEVRTSIPHKTLSHKRCSKWEHLKAFVYRTAIQDVQSLRARIVAGYETIRNTPGMFQSIRDSIRTAD